MRLSLHEHLADSMKVSVVVEVEDEDGSTIIKQRLHVRNAALLIEHARGTLWIGEADSDERQGRLR